MPFPYTFPIDWSVQDFPDLDVYVAFATEPGETPVWTNITSHVRRISTRMGRQHELARMEAATADIMIDNRDRRFDPTHAGSPYYPFVLPMRRIKAVAHWLDTSYPLFAGFVEGWPQTWLAGTDALVPIAAVDGFKVLALDKISPTIGEGLSGSHITAALNAAGWPAADRIVDAGEATMQAVTLENEQTLKYCLEIAESENGWFYIDRQGRAVFRNRHYRLTDKFMSEGIFGDEPGELPYKDLVISYDDSELWNKAVAQRIGGAEQTWEDTGSQGRYHIRVLEKPELRLSSDPQVLSLVQAWVGLYSEPGLRIRKIILKPTKDNGLWPHVLGREIGDRITVIRRPPGGGARIEQDVHIEAIEHDISPLNWATGWTLSPAISSTFWELDDPDLSQLGITTRLAF